METIRLLQKSINLKRYEYFFRLKGIDAPNSAVFCRSISQQLHALVKDNENLLAYTLYNKNPDFGYLFEDVELNFIFRSSPIDEIKELTPIFFSIIFQGDGYDECYHGLAIWSEQSQDFYIFLIAAPAPAATTLLDYNFSDCLSRFFHQQQDSEKESDLDS